MELTAAGGSFSRYQKFVLALLTFLQFTIILDFMILSPLGAALMPALGINTAQFGFVVSVYAFSAAASGFLAAGFADRFDRKRLLLFFYAGFLLGTLLCGVANSYATLIAARLVTGFFGGVLGSIVLAVAADLFNFEKQGQVMGAIQTAFAASQILGLPLGLLLSNWWGWRAPFLMIALMGTAVGVAILFGLKPIDGHLHLSSEVHALKHLKKTLGNPAYRLAFLANALLATGGFMLLPFASAFTVHNLGIDIRRLPIIYLITGLSAMVSGPVVGKLSDRFGKFKTFFFGTVLSILTVLIYTNLGVTPIYTVIAVNVLMFVGVFSRMVPSQALMAAIPDQASRGSFMSVSASVQQVSGGLSSVLAGWIVIEGEGGLLLHFNYIGYILVAISSLNLILMHTLEKMVLNRAPGGPIER